MTPPLDRIPLSEETGKDRWNKSVQIERLMLKLRDLAVRATYRGNADIATPAEFDQWAKDLRRGRMSIIGSIKRFCDLIDQRHMGEPGRQLKREAAAFVQEYIDISVGAWDITQQPINTRAVDIKPTKTHVVLYSKFLSRRA